MLKGACEGQYVDVLCVHFERLYSLKFHVSLGEQQYTVLHWIVQYKAHNLDHIMGIQFILSAVKLRRFLLFFVTIFRCLGFIQPLQMGLTELICYI